MSSRASALCYWALVIALLAVVWFGGQFPAQDAAAHVYTAKVMSVLWTDPASPLHAVFEFNPHLTTNWTGHLLLASMLLALPPEAANRLMLSLIVLLIAGGLYWCFRSLNQDSFFLLPIGLLVSANSMLFMGFYSFLLGLGFLLCALGLWLSRWQEGSLLRWVALGVLLAACWLSHPLCWAVALGAIALQALGDWRTLAKVALAASPTLVLAGHFATRFGGASEGAPLLRGEPLGLLIVENPFMTLHLAFAGVALELVLVVALSMLAAFRQGITRSRTADRLLAMAVLLLVAWPLAPRRTMTGNFVPRRLFLFALIFCLLWVASQRWAPHWRKAVGVLNVVGGAALIAVIAWRCSVLQPYFEEYSTMRAGGSTLGLRYRMSPEGRDGGMLTVGLDPFLHSADWLVLRDGGIDLNNYEAATPHFPLRYRGSYRIGFRTDENEEPPCVEFTRSGDGLAQPETLLLWDYPEGAKQPCVVALREALASGYELTGRSKPRGLGEIWRRRQP
jgi:hypothetical protein